MNTQWHLYQQKVLSMTLLLSSKIEKFTSDKHHLKSSKLLATTNGIHMMAGAEQSLITPTFKRKFPSRLTHEKAFSSSLPTHHFVLTISGFPTDISHEQL